MREVLLGFDARLDWTRSEPHDYLAIWQNRYRLRDDVNWPFSTEQMLWPSVLDHGDVQGTPEERASYGQGGPPVPAGIGTSERLWASLPMLKGFLAEHAGEIVRPYVLVAFTVATRLRPYYLAENPQPSPWTTDPRRRSSTAQYYCLPGGLCVWPTEPPDRDPRWPFLGYDIANWNLESYLCGIGWHGRARQARRRRWAGLLNDYHLLTDLEDAERFRRAADRIDADSHYVYGIWSVEASGHAPRLE